MRISDWSSDVCLPILSRRIRHPASRFAAAVAVFAIAAGHARAWRLTGLARAMPPFPIVGGKPHGHDEEDNAEDDARAWHRQRAAGQIGRASCRESVCKYV